MNIESSNVKLNKESQDVTKTSKNATKLQDSNVKFSDELKDLDVKEKSNELSDEKSAIKEIPNSNSLDYQNISLKNKMGNALVDMNSVMQQFNQLDEKQANLIKKEDSLDDNINMINKDFNIQENKDLMPQMNPNMNFSGDGQPFSSFMNNSSNQEQKLSVSVKDLAEEAAILSTMTENIALANKKTLVKDSKVVSDEEGIKKVDVKTGITVENVVKYDSVIMNQADVEVFATLVEKAELDFNNLAPKSLEKSIQVSKTLADMLAKAMDSKQPIRIDFDNDISVIIKISRDGKISADFLPSSQIAEAYLKENLPLLRQRFEDNNIKYDELNQRERKDQNREHNRRKERNNE